MTLLAPDAPVATAVDSPRPTALALRASGALDHSTGDSLREAVDRVAARPEQLLVVDVRDVEVRDAAGLRALDDLRRVRDRAPAVVVIHGVSAARDEILRADRRLRQLRGAAT